MASPITADLWDLDGIKVVSVNSAGVHGRGLANQAMKLGFIHYGQNRNFRESPKEHPVRCVCVKGNAPHTARIPGKVWSEAVVDGNLEMMKQELTALAIEASFHPWRTYYLPMIGMGFGEGDPVVIYPILDKLSDEHPNIVLVSRSPVVVSRHAASMRPGVRGDKSVASLKAFTYLRKRGP